MIDTHLLVFAALVVTLAAYVALAIVNGEADGKLQDAILIEVGALAGVSIPRGAR